MLFPSIFDDMAFDRNETSLMKTDVIKGNNETKLVIDLPGIKKEDVNISLQNGYLTISCETNEEKNEENEGKYIYRERSTRSCSRSFDVGTNTTEDDIDASLNDGVLTVALKHVDNTPENKRIEIK